MTIIAAALAGDMLAHPKTMPHLNTILGEGWRLDHGPGLIAMDKGCEGGMLVRPFCLFAHLLQPLIGGDLRSTATLITPRTSTARARSSRASSSSSTSSLTRDPATAASPVRQPTQATVRLFSQPGSR